MHCDFVRSEQSNNPQTPLKKSALPNLSEDQCDNFCLVLEAIQENLRQYNEIRNKLNK